MSDQEATRKPPALLRPSACLNQAIATFGNAHPKIMVGLEAAYRIIGLATAIWFGVIANSIIGAIGFPGFLETAFTGLSLQTTALGFYNGTVTSVVHLLVVYGALCALMVPAARFLCDAAALYTLFFSVTLPVYQFPIVAAPLAVVFSLWVIQRLVLGTIVLRYRRSQK